eukprot:6209802-Pleurochrysis_carterae.AAC.1
MVTRVSARLPVAPFITSFTSRIVLIDSLRRRTTAQTVIPSFDGEAGRWRRGVGLSHKDTDECAAGVHTTYAIGWPRRRRRDGAEYSFHELTVHARKLLRRNDEVISLFGGERTDSGDGLSS